jgi:hypothetical protein
VTVGDWLGTRTPPLPPTALAERVRSALGARWDADEREVHDACEAAAEELLAALLARRETGRESALDLLAADALTTYAFEYAAVAGRNLDVDSAAAMRRIAALGARYARAVVA